MKQYPKIDDSKNFFAKHCIAFNKYDGSNLRFEWTKKNGFYKFGTRKRLFDKTDEVFGSAITIFMDIFSKKMETVFKSYPIFHGVREIICFAEFFGEHSFAGQHLIREPKQLVLFDVWLFNKGLIGPKEFTKIFSKEVPSAKVVYEGVFNGQFAEEIRRGDFKDKNVFEGVVCKAGEFENIEMCKIKTNDYLDKLKAVFHDKWMNFWE